MLGTLTLAVALAADGGVVAAIAARLEAGSTISGRFTQEKRIRGFKRPVMSTGTFRVERGRGVEWKTVAPFPSTLSVTRQSITARSGDAELYRLDAATQPGVEVVTRVLFAVLSGELELLGAHFAVEGEVSPRSWSAVLTPTAPPLRAVVGRITLSGARTVERVELLEASGDSTHITLVPDAPDGGSPRP